MSSYADLIPTSVHGNYTPTVIRPWTTLSLTNGTNLQEHPIVSPFKIYTEHTHFSTLLPRCASAAAYGYVSASPLVSQHAERSL